jgi:hypothetical protein
MFCFFVCIIFCLFLVSRIMIVLCSFVSLNFCSSKLFNFTDVLFYYVLANRQFRYPTSLKDERKQHVFFSKNVYEIEKDLFPYVVWYLSRTIKTKTRSNMKIKCEKLNLIPTYTTKLFLSRRHQICPSIHPSFFPH